MTVKSSSGKTTAIQLLLKYLKAEGVDYIFGIPGGPLMPLYEALHELGNIQPILTKHEEGAAFMADGYARVRRGIGVCCATSGPGSTNSVTGIAVSYADGVPVMLITAQVSTSAFGKGASQEGSSQGIDVVDIFKPMTKSSMMLTRADKMGEVTRYLLRVAKSGRPGPVHLSIPADIAKTLVPQNEKIIHQRTINNNYFDRETIKEASFYLLRAKKPAILVGNGINFAGAYKELKLLSEKLTIPVITTVKAKGAFPEDHLLSMGVFGLAGSPRAEAYLLSGEIDVLLAIGTSLGEDATNSWDERLKPKDALLQIDIDPEQMGKNYPVKVPLIGDAKTVLTELLYQIDRDQQWRDDPKQSVEEIKKFRLQHPWCIEEEKMDSDAVPIKPQRLMKDLNKVLPSDAIVFVDIGTSMCWAFHYLKIHQPYSFFHNLGFASMGHATAACVGAKLAAPNRPVIAIVGDGAFAMNGMEVHTACEYNIPVIWLVHNNGGYGMVYHGEKVQFGGKFNNSLFHTPLDVCKIGEALGAKTYRVSKPGDLCHVMSLALSEEKPTVIEANIDVEELPPIGARFKALDQFFDGSSNKTKPEPVFHDEFFGKLIKTTDHNHQ